MGGPVPRLEIRLLGPLEVRVAGLPVEISRGRAATLLAVLSSADGPVPAGILAERVWGDGLRTDPRTSLHTTVRRLRALLGPEAITSAGGAYTLRADIDVRRFGQLLDRAGRSDDQVAELGLLRDALALWRGEPFDREQSGWAADQERPRLTERYLTAVERQLDLESSATPTADVIADLRALTSRYPLREPLWARLINGLSATGRVAEALSAYEKVRTLLADELGADPGAELQRLHAELAPGDPTGSTVVPRQLPAGVGDFTGRVEALGRLDELHARDDAALVVVHGSGGVGKTSLVVHWANRVRDAFPDGQVFVGLRGFGPGDPVVPADALQTVLRGLGVAGAAIPPDVEARTGLLRTTLAGRRVLIVLDDARDAAQVRPLLPGAGATVLITSRNQLRGLAVREHAERIALGTLTEAESSSLLADRLKGQGIEYDDRALAELADRCGHLPLALIVAAERAGRYGGTALTDLIRELDEERLDVLETGDDLSTSVRAVISWSVRLLDPEDARLFRLLGVQPAGELSLPAVAALAGRPPAPVRRSLDRLTDLHLVERHRPDRASMHDLVRVYAAERAQLEDPLPMREHALADLYGWYAWTAYNAMVAMSDRRPPFLDGTVPQGLEPATFAGMTEAMAWFATELVALTASLSGAEVLGRHDDVIRLGTTLSEYFEYSGGWDSVGPISARALAATRASGNIQAEANVLIDIGVTHMRRGELEDAMSSYLVALELNRRIGNRRGECAVLCNVGVIHRRHGQLPEAIAILEGAAALARLIGNGRLEATALNNLASAYRDSARFPEAVRTAEGAVRLRRELGQPVEEAYALDTLGETYRAQGRPADALACFERALAIHRDTGSRWFEAHALKQIGNLARSIGEVDRARECWREALRVMDEIDAEDHIDLSRAELHTALGTDPV